jgi:hypothetical protein
LINRGRSVNSYNNDVSLTLDIQNIGDPTLKAELAGIIEHTLSGRPGEWRVTILCSRASDEWELRINGPNEFERVYVLNGTAGEHEPRTIHHLLMRLLPRNESQPS